MLGMTEKDPLLHFGVMNRETLPGDHGVGSTDHIQESDISMLYYLSHSHFTTFEK